MSKKKSKGKYILGGLAAAVAYSVIAGKGPFNGFRFKNQHEALTKYMDANYPDCIYTPITASGKGYSSTIIRNGKVVCFVYFSKDNDDNYIFTELDEKIK